MATWLWNKKSMIRSLIGNRSNDETEEEVPPTDNTGNQHEITLKEYIAGKRPVPGLESWTDAVRNGRGPITIFGILQPIIGVLIATKDEIVNVDLATTNRNYF